MAMLINFSVPFLLVILLKSRINGETVPERCDIPGGTQGMCVVSKQCEPYVTAIQAISLQHAEFLGRVQCYMKETVSYVCCPEGKLYNFTDIQKPTEKPQSYSIEMESRHCGYENSDRIVGGQVAQLDEFPWMALIVYGKKYPSGSPVLACGGALISRRYVLTAGHCTSGGIYEKLGKISKVRLGEQNLETEIDCEGEPGQEDCAPPVLEAAPEDLIVHPEYDPDSKNQANDIALIRLDRDIQYTDFIQPICLPDASTPSVRHGNVLQVAGWGTTELYPNSPLKLKISLPVVAPEFCRPTYLKHGITLTDRQICAGGQDGKDSCKGDSGGPLMMKGHFNRWVVSGVVSFGPTRCGRPGVPGVYTGVRDYLPWIKSSVKP